MTIELLSRQRFVDQVLHEEIIFRSLILGVLKQSFVSCIMRFPSKQYRIQHFLLSKFSLIKCCFELNNRWKALNDECADRNNPRIKHYGRLLHLMPREVEHFHSTYAFKIVKKTLLCFPQSFHPEFSKAISSQIGSFRSNDASCNEYFVERLFPYASSSYPCACLIWS